MKAKWLVGVLVACAAGSSAALAAEPPAADPRIEVAKHLPGAKPDQLRPSPIPGLWEYTRGTEIAYVTPDGKYAISGDLYDLKANNDLTDARRRDLRAKAIAAFPEDKMLVFGPSDAKYTVTVFSDVDCQYCRKLHSQVADYNKLGIRIRYLMYPRTGPDTVSWTKAEQVWCSPDRNAALTKAKLGEELKVKACPNNPVASTYALGKDFSVQGTPSLVLPDGDMIDGYIPPDVLLARLKESAHQ